MNPEKTIIVYKSKTNFTRRYAVWLSDALDCLCISQKEATVEALKHYDTIIFGGGIYAGKINGIDFLLKNMSVFKDKNLAVFATGCTPAAAVNVDKLAADNLKEFTKIPFFYMNSGLAYEQMSGTDRFLMKCLALGMKISGNKKTLEVINHSHDNSEKSNIEPMVEFIRENY